MTARLARALTPAGLLCAAGAVAALVGQGLAGRVDVEAMQLALVVVLVAGVGLLLWLADPALTLSLAVVLSVFGGNWQALGLPANVTPDRFVLAAGLLTLVVRAPGAEGRPALRLRPVHWVLIATALYAIVSALAAETLFNGVGGFRLLDRLGLLPFALFFAAPLAFDTERRRRILLLALTALGGYLGVVTLAQMAGATALVWPQYILDPAVGTHIGRGRGPFAQAAVNGMAMFACGLAAVQAQAWIRSAVGRAACAGVVGLCAIGVVLCLQRSVWVGAAAAVVVTVLATPGLRRYAIPLVLAGVLATLGTLALVPGVSEKARERGGQSETVRDRINSDRAALNMIRERPLTGFGWDTFTAVGREHYSLAADYALKVPKNLPVHNVFLGNAAELGLVGTGLWLLALLLGVGGALTARPPPDLVPWRTSLLALAVLYLVVANASPLTNLFPNALLWLWAGVVLGPALRERSAGVSPLARRPGWGWRPRRSASDRRPRGSRRPPGGAGGPRPAGT